MSGRHSMSAQAVCVLGLALLACGGEDDGRPSATPAQLPVLPPVDQCALASGYELQTIVDFERRAMGFDPTLAVCAPTSPCSFYFNTDETRAILPSDQPPPVNYNCLIPAAEAPTVSTPMSRQSTLNGTEFPGERCGAPGSALHVTATNLGMCYGSDGRLGWGAGLDVTFAPPLNAADWEGIAFWVRRGSPDARPSIILSVIDPFTSGAALPSGEASCYAGDPDPRVPDTEKCDAFGMAVTLQDEWAFIAAPFAAMTQKGFGAVSPNGAVDKGQITRLQFLLTAGDKWDIWLDDVALFRKRN